MSFYYYELDDTLKNTREFTYFDNTPETLYFTSESEIN